MLYIFNRWLCYAPRQSVIDIKRTPGGWKEERALAFWQATPALIDMEIAVSLRERRTMSIFPSLVNYQIRCSETINIIESCSVSYMNWWNWSKIMRNFANRKHNFHLFPLNVSINYIYTFNIVFRMFISMHDVSFRSIIAIANYNFEKYLRRVDKKYIGYRKSKRTRHIRIIPKITNSPNTGLFKKYDSKRMEMPRVSQ